MSSQDEIREKYKRGGTADLVGRLPLCAVGALSAAPHAVLLSAKGYLIAQLADIIDADRDTVSGWLDVWEQFGLLGLRDRHRPGRPRKGAEADREQLFQAVQAAPHQLRALPLQFQERTGFSV